MRELAQSRPEARRWCGARLGGGGRRSAVGDAVGSVSSVGGASVGGGQLPTGPDGLFVLDGLKPGQPYDLLLVEPTAMPRVARSGVLAHYPLRALPPPLPSARSARSA